jgi:DNA-binding NtrC family response regulator
MWKSVRCYSDLWQETCSFKRMPQETIVVFGNLPIEPRALDFPAAEFDWSLSVAKNWIELQDLAARQDVVAVLFNATTLGLSWKEALLRIAAAAPEARPIVCHQFSDLIDWPKLVDAGAFHSLAVPLDSQEVRKSLGFIWASRRRRPMSKVHRFPAAKTKSA